MIVDETGKVNQSMKDIQKNNCFKMPRETCRYEALQSAAKIEIHRGCFLRNFVNPENGYFREYRYLGELFLKRKQKRLMVNSDPCTLRFSLFPG